jgi:predicted metal-dependent peptidase
LLKQPFYGYAAASISPVESREAAKISMVTMPSLKIIYNREWFESLSDQHAVGVVIHELLHLILLHPVRRDGRERSLWVIACDMAVNEHIDESLLPKDYITVEKIGKEIKEVLPRSKSAEFYYGILSENEEKLSFVGSDKEIKIMLKSGLELKANNSVEDDSSEVNKSAFISTVSELVQQARAEGEVLVL